VAMVYAALKSMEQNGQRIAISEVLKDDQSRAAV